VGAVVLTAKRQISVALREDVWFKDTVYSVVLFIAFALLWLARIAPFLIAAYIVMHLIVK